LQPLPGGITMAEASAANLAAALPRWLAVVAADGDPELARRLAARGGEIAPYSAAGLGLGHRLARGLQAAGHAGGWSLALADMPAVKPGTIRRLAMALAAGAPIAAPFLGGKRGNPVGFSAAFRPQLLALAGDQGARRVIEAHPERVWRIETGDA